jgi:hypothetical protein
MRRLIKRVVVAGVGGADEGCASELADGNVVRMSIGPIRAKGDNDLWPYAPQMRDDTAYSLGRIGPVQVAVNVVQERHVAYAKDGGGGA